MKNRLVFKMKYRYKIELQTSLTIKLFGSTKNDLQNRNCKNLLSLEVVKVALVLYHLEDNQYHLKSDVYMQIILMLICSKLNQAI